METVIRIGTHDGVFHADDVFAVAALQRVFVNTIIVRSRNPEVLEKCGILVDVGGVYDADVNKFDHHQKGRAGERPNGVLYSSFGLVWAKYGEHICGSKEVADVVDRRLVQHVDAIDNGQQLFEGPPRFHGCAQFNVSTFISLMNPRYDEGSDYESGFYASLTLADHILDRLIESIRGEIAAREQVRQACLAAGNSEVVVFHRFLPWQTSVLDYASPNAKYVVFPSEAGTWMVQTIPIAPGSFTPRAPLPEAWGGLRDKEFRETTGLSGAVFCHPGRFIMGASDLPTALQLAAMASM